MYELLKEKYNGSHCNEYARTGYGMSSCWTPGSACAGGCGGCGDPPVEVVDSSAAVPREAAPFRMGSVTIL